MGLGGAGLMAEGGAAAAAGDMFGLRGGDVSSGPYKPSSAACGGVCKYTGAMRFAGGVLGDNVMARRDNSGDLCGDSVARICGYGCCCCCCCCLCVSCP